MMAPTTSTSRSIESTGLHEEGRGRWIALGKRDCRKVYRTVLSEMAPLPHHPLPTARRHYVRLLPPGEYMSSGHTVVAFTAVENRL